MYVTEYTSVLPDIRTDSSKDDHGAEITPFQALCGLFSWNKKSC